MMATYTSIIIPLGYSIVYIGKEYILIRFKVDFTYCYKIICLSVRMSPLLGDYNIRMKVPIKSQSLRNYYAVECCIVWYMPVEDMNNPSTPSTLTSTYLRMPGA